MNFDWLQYLELAEYILNNLDKFPDEEAGCRVIASRSYYAMFCSARNFIRQADGENISDHQKLQEYFKKNPNNKDRVTVGNQLKKLHQLRKIADYEDNLRRMSSRGLATNALSQAKRIKQKLDNFNTAP